MSPTQIQTQKSPFIPGPDFYQPSPRPSPERSPSAARSVHGVPWAMTELPAIQTLPSLSQTVYDSDALSAATSNPTPSSSRGVQLPPHSFSPLDANGILSMDASRNNLNSPPRPHVTRNVTAPLSPTFFRRKSQHPHIINEAYVVTQQAAPHPENRKRSGHDRRSGSRDKIHYGHHSHNRSTSSGNSYHYGIAGTTPPRTRERRERDKKVMLSRALQKANMAVKLDHVQNFEGAIEAYEDACRLLHQVLDRSSGDEDKRKLESIRKTYTSRILELRVLAAEARAALGHQDMPQKALPRRPMSDDSADSDINFMSPFSPIRNYDASEDEGEDRRGSAKAHESALSPGNDPSAHQSLLRDSTVLASAFQEVEKSFASAEQNLVHQQQQHTQGPKQLRHYPQLGPPWTKPLRDSDTVVNTLSIRSPMDTTYMPPPLSPRRPSTPQLEQEETQAPPSHTPPPQSTTKALSPPVALPAASEDRADQSQAQHRRKPSEGATDLLKEDTISWLNTIDESDSSSCASSVHSMEGLTGVRRKPVHRTSGNTEAEFDAALDAAVEAAYDEGFEPDEDDNAGFQALQVTGNRGDSFDRGKALEPDPQAERERLIEAAKVRDRENRMQGKVITSLSETDGGFKDQIDDEERLLDDIAREHILNGFDFDLRAKISLPRQSDSSGFSGSTWSSVASNRTTAGTSLSTVAEAKINPLPAPTKDAGTVALPPLPTAAPTHIIPAPSQPPPPPPAAPSSGVATTTTGNTPNESSDSAQHSSSSRPLSHTSVRSRRLSGLNPRQLKIETSARYSITTNPNLGESEITVPPAPQTEPPYAIPKSSDEQSSLSLLPDTVFKPSFINKNLSIPLPSRAASPAETTVSASPNTAAGFPFSVEAEDIPPSPSKHVGRLGGLRKNKSSVSLKNRALSLSSPEGSDASVNTPMSINFSVNKRGASNTVAAAPALPTPGLAAFSSEASTVLFESNIHSPNSPGSPNQTALNAPIPLEPCPEVFLLRPFWLMRAIYQTLTHPRGGYLSTKLFVPKDVWTAKSVKLKNLDDKIATCDLLTAALQKLAVVDTYDADAVLEEMQALELVLDQAQTTLNKKVGSEVGIAGMSSMFRGASAGSAGTGAGTTGDGLSIHSEVSSSARSAMSQSKSMLSSWRKLRSKNSSATPSIMTSGPGGAVPNGAVFGGVSAGGHGSSNSGAGNSGLALGGAASGAGKDAINNRDASSLSMPTLPMTGATMAHQQVRFARRDLAHTEFSGPNANYMGSLARLFDAVQVLDQVARQVEDPGLKYSSSTHVGLELSARHAAEFFGFYVCRFVLNDLGTLLDKFIKRGSEWVLV